MTRATKKPLVHSRDTRHKWPVIDRTKEPFTHFRAFAAIAGMSPCLGVPPVDCLFFGSSIVDGGKEPPRSKPQPQPRRRHFSLEDYHEGLFEESSNDSYSAMMDLKPIKSFINGELKSFSCFDIFVIVRVTCFRYVICRR